VKVNFPCRCGHSKMEHYSYSRNDVFISLICCSTKGLCECLDFKTDNLRYLEQLSENR